ncbi:hypothetical protein GCM10010168_46780 [Actinoplanes ianthinogenes]|uniref:Uncharacterized protein n=1 Tax=Actinoplanes ianthinogenes TaxID=122358 RepID=A0ABM7LP94_9ACTN|nr:hypothetical protein [Actinoplanes ianthinogenes]BCJ41023.1 hypothetical protein Aiant_16800 [Actinoplanes ianthinogenes]GGR23437.1 hypothetical protein GCM10010168_46780 [Actinoplanes ianthinogenes]
MTWLEFALLHTPAPTTVRVTARHGNRYAEPTVIGPVVVNPTRTVVFCPPDTDVPPGSLVTLPTGQTTRVRATCRLDALGFRLPGHLQLDLEQPAMT